MGTDDEQARFLRDHEKGMGRVDDAIRAAKDRPPVAARSPGEWAEQQYEADIAELESRLREAEAESEKRQVLIDVCCKNHDRQVERAHVAEARVERLEAELREAREALFEQWETAHFDHCTRLEDGRCPREGGPVGCMWPMPEFLRARGGLEKGDKGPVA